MLIYCHWLVWTFTVCIYPEDTFFSCRGSINIILSFLKSRHTQKNSFVNVIKIKLYCNNWMAPCENVSASKCGQQRPISACTSALTESLDTKKCINGKQMPGWDFAHTWDNSESVDITHA